MDRIALFLRKSNNDSLQKIKTPEGFESLYCSYVKKLCAICFNQVRDEVVSEEIVHNVFKSLWERRETLELNGPIENYLVRAVKLSVIDHFRTKASHKQHLECALVDYCGTDHCTENQILYNELEQKVNLLIDKLPCQCQEVFRLSREKGLSNKEIASSLLISEKTVEAHMSKALKFLRGNLTEYQP